MIPFSPALIVSARQIMQFMETRDLSALDHAFMPANVTLIDSFPPYIFQGTEAVMRWASGFIVHAQKLADLRHTFGEPQEYSSDGNTAYVSLPVTWRGLSGNTPFHETGGMALVLINNQGRWQIQNYSWAATSYMTG